MAEPTLKDVLNALSRLEKGQAALEKGQAALEKGQAALEKGQAETRAEMATKDALESVAADVKAHRDETRGGFAALDRELAGHSERTHRAIEDRLDKIESVIKTPKRAAAPRAPRRR